MDGDDALGARAVAELERDRKDHLPMRFGANKKMFSSLSSSFRADCDLFSEGVRFVDMDEGETLPLPVERSSLSSADTPRAAFCLRVRALIVDGGGVGCVDGAMDDTTRRQRPVESTEQAVVFAKDRSDKE